MTHHNPENEYDGSEDTELSIFPGEHSNEITRMGTEDVFSSQDTVEAKIYEGPEAIRKKMVGAYVGDYEILEEVGRGGMGVVYKARHRTLDRVVALKMVLHAEHSGANALDRFMLEARAVAQLDHQNIVRVFDIGRHQGLPYFTLEFVDGDSLKDNLVAQALHPKTAANYVALLADALQCAHDAGIMHRDVKPANILISNSGSIKLVDFGLAKEVDSKHGSTKTGQVMGTPSFMSPEQAQGLTDLGPASDQYSLGAVLYRMLTGRPPFAADQPHKTVVQVIQKDPIAPSQLREEIDRDLETICLKTLEKNPKNRYADCAQLAADLRRYLTGNSIVARPSRKSERLIRWCRRNPSIAIPSLAAIILLISISAVSTWAYFKVSRQNAAIQQQKKFADTQTLIAREQSRIARTQSEKAIAQAQNSLKLIQEIFNTASVELRGNSENEAMLFKLARKLSDELSQIDPNLLGNERANLIPTLISIRQEMITIFSARGEWDEAIQDCDLLQSLARKQLDSPEASPFDRFILARTLQQHARILTQTQQDVRRIENLLVEARAITESLNAELASGVFESIDRKTPTATQLEGFYASNIQCLGAHYESRDMFEEAASYFSRSIELHERSLGRIDTNPEIEGATEARKSRMKLSIRENILRMKLGLANINLKRNKTTEAFAQFETVLDSYSKRVNHPRAPMPFRLNYANQLSVFGRHLTLYAWSTGQSQTVGEFKILEAIEIFEHIESQFPDQLEAKIRKAKAHFYLGEYYQLVERRDEAEDQLGLALAQARALTKISTLRRTKELNMLIEAKVGNWKRAETAATELAYKGSTRQTFMAGCALLDAAERDGAPDSFRAIGQKYLKAAREHGYNNQFNWSHMPQAKRQTELQQALLSQPD